MNADSVREIWQRAGRRCEYCHLAAGLHPLPFQIDHIVARQHGGRTELENLALSCLHCNRFKGPNIAGFDAGTGEIVRLFHPRRDLWAEHFRWAGAELYPLTAVGRVTAVVLFINDPAAIALRRALGEEAADIL